jgi:hypothetical protein
MDLIIPKIVNATSAVDMPILGHRSGEDGARIPQNGTSLDQTQDVLNVERWFSMYPVLKAEALILISLDRRGPNMLARTSLNRTRRMDRRANQSCAIGVQSSSETGGYLQFPTRSPCSFNFIRNFDTSAPPWFWVNDFP